jgi:phage N-6-adenine-methyltransferase
VALPIAKLDDRQQIVWDDAANARDRRTRTKEDRRSTADPRRPGSLIPDLSVAEYNSLTELIRSQGVRVPIIVDQDGKIVDGRQRDRICKELGIDCPRVVQHFASEAERLQVAITLNIPRRHWSCRQRRELIAAYLKLDPAINDNGLGDIVGVSKNTVASVRGELESTCQIDKLEQRRGRDGKDRPAKYRQILATTPKEAEEAIETIKSLPSACEGKLLGSTDMLPVRRALVPISGGLVAESLMSLGGGGDPTDHDDIGTGNPVILPAHRRDGDAKAPDNAALGDKGGDVLRPAMVADEIQEPGRGLCEWNTPDWLFQLLDSEFHFTLDAAALPLNTKCKKFFTPQDDGRKQSWAGEVVWCNPPFNREVIGLWVQKAYEESQRGAVVVMVLPTPFKGYKWWGTYCTQGQVRFVHQFVTFAQSDGPKKARLDVTIIVFGQGYTGAGCPVFEGSRPTSAKSTNHSKTLLAY